MARNLAACFGMVVDAPEIITGRHRCECAIERQDLEAMTRQIEFSHNLGSQQGNDVRTDVNPGTRQDFFGDRSSAKHVPALKHKDFLPSLRQVCGTHQSVMSAADDDDVVFLLHVSTMLASVYNIPVVNSTQPSIATMAPGLITPSLAL